MHSTYTHDISYNEPIWDGEKQSWNHDHRVEKAVSFKELVPTDREQHKFQMRILSLLSSNDENISKEFFGLNVGSDDWYDLVVDYIRTMIVITPEFTSKDMEIMLNDISVIFAFGTFVFPKKIIPFFPKLMRGLAKPA